MPTIDHELLHEEAMFQQGIASYRQSITYLNDNHRLSDSKAGSRLLYGSVFDLANQIEAFIQTALTGKPGRHNKAATLMKDFDAGVMAYCAVRGDHQFPDQADLDYQGGPQRGDYGGGSNQVHGLQAG